MKKTSILIIISLVLAGTACAGNTWIATPGLPAISHAFNVTSSAWPARGNNSTVNNAQAQAMTTPAAPLVLTFTAAPGLQAAAGVTGAAAAQMPSGVTANAAPVDEGQAAYDSLTVTPDFNYRPAFVESKYEKNELARDIAVSAVEAVPFGFLLTFGGIFLVEAAGQGTFQPKLKTLQDYSHVYEISIGALAALNIAINTLFFYDYKKEDSHAKKAEEK